MVVANREAVPGLGGVSNPDEKPRGSSAYRDAPLRRIRAAMEILGFSNGQYRREHQFPIDIN